MSPANLGNYPLIQFKLDTTSSTAISGVAGQVIRVYAMFFSMASSTITFKDGSTALTGAITTTQMILDMHPSLHPRFECSSGNDFTITLGGSQQVSGTIWYTIGPK